jgi:adenine deaminase
LKTFISGELVAENGKSLISRVDAPVINNFHCDEKSPADFEIRIPFVDLSSKEKMVQVIEALDGQLITRTHLHPLSRLSGSLPIGTNDALLHADIENDILLFTVVNRL